MIFKLQIKLDYSYSGYNNLEVADYLLEQGADVNAQEFVHFLNMILLKRHFSNVFIYICVNPFIMDLSPEAKIQILQKKFQAEMISSSIFEKPNLRNDSYSKTIYPKTRRMTKCWRSG